MARKQKTVDNLQVANFIAETGDISIKTFHTRFTSSFTVKILLWLDELGIVERRGMGRFLNCSVANAVKIIRSTPWKYTKKKTGPKENSHNHISKNILYFLVEKDPLGYFKRGAVWPAWQVWGKDREEWPEEDEFAIGTQLRLHKHGRPTDLYEMTERGFVRI